MKPRAVVCFLLTAYSVVCAAQARNTSTQIFNRNKDSVVIVMAGKDGDKSSLEGSGFVIAKDQVVTNFHVVRDSDVAVVAFQDGRREDVKGAVFFDPDLDLVVLSVPTKDVPPIALGDELSLRQGNHVLALGAPEGLNLSLTDGIVSAFRKVKGAFMIQSTAPISHGSSGGPLLNEQGQAVGITTLGVNNNVAGIYFAVGVSDLKQLLKSQMLGVRKLADLSQDEEDPLAAPAGQPEANVSGSHSTAPVTQPSPSSPVPAPAAKPADQNPIQDLLNQKRFAEARSLVDDALAKGIESSTLLRQKGIIEWEYKNYSAASRYFEKSISVDAGDAQTRLQYTGLLLDLGEWNRALVQAEAFNRLNPGVDARRFLALVYYLTHRYSDARNMAESVLAADSSDVQALKILAGISYWSGPIGNSAWRRYVDELRTTAPDAVWVHVSAALAKSRQDPAAAFAELDLAAKDQFPEAAPFLLAADFRVQAHEYKKADQSIRAGLSMSAHDPGMLQKAVWISLLNHKEVEAGRYLEAMKKLMTPTPEELDAAACLYYYRIDDVQSALPYCQDEIQYRPGNPETYVSYGWALLDAGNFKEARRQFEQAESLRNPNQSMPREQLIHEQWAMILASYYTGDRRAAGSMLKALRASDSSAVDVNELKKLALVLSDPTLKRIHDVARALK